MTQNPQPSSPCTVGVLYIGRTEGEMTTVIGKVGLTAAPETVTDRANSFRVADRIFSFVLEAAFAVELPPNVEMASVESWVHSNLEGRGLVRFGENFAAPDSNMSFLARMASEAISSLGYKFVPLDISAQQTLARERNGKTWQTLRKSKKAKSEDPYDAWLFKYSEPPRSLISLARPRHYLCNVLAMGYLLKDLASGSGLDCIEIPLYRGGALKIYPSSLEAALFEHRAEVDLDLDSTTSFSACPSSLEQIPFAPNAMTILLGANLEFLEIPNTFILPTRERPNEVRISPDHLAALGKFGGVYNGNCFYEGLGVRAQVPLELHPFILKYPDLLPGIRFWLGVGHCRKEGLRIQDFALPACVGQLWNEKLLRAADVMKMAGFPVPKPVQAWVAHGWLPGLRASVSRGK